MNTKISVVTINYNNAAGLEKTIQSVINQDYDNLEYIVIDGGSIDNSKAVIANSIDKINYWVSEPDRGIYHAMNKGIIASSGAYLLFLNSGDVLIDNKVIDRVSKQMVDADIICGNLIFDKQAGPENWVPADEVTFKTFLYSTIPHPSTFIHRRLFDLVGMYNEQLKIVSDWEFFLLATCKYNCSYHHVDVFITRYCDGGVSSDPTNFPAINEERRIVLNKYFSYFLPDYSSYELQIVTKNQKNKILNKIKRFLRKFKETR